MSENEDKLQKLLQLKNYETPGPEYFDSFLTEFHQRQQLELTRLTKSEMVKEKVAMWVDGLGPSKWAVPTGSMAALSLALVAFMWGGRDRPIVDNNPAVDQLDPTKSETQVLQLDLPKPSGRPSPKPAAAPPKGVVPVQY